MKEHPLLLSAPMVLAALAGRKHITRRILSKHNTLIDGKMWGQSKCKWRHMKFDRTMLMEGKLVIACVKDGAQLHTITPIYRPGDVVWFKETHAACLGCAFEPGNPVLYRADAKQDYDKLRWRSSMFMPRWASRIVRPIIGAHIERVQDITEEQAEREGVAWFSTEGTTAEKTFIATKYPNGYRTNFMLLWDLLRPKPNQHWKDNPLVIAIEFNDEVRP